MQPRTGDFLGSDREAGLFRWCGTGAYVGRPHVGTEAPASNWESAVGSGSSMLLCALCSAETASGLGLRETRTLLSPEALVLDTEICHAQQAEFKRSLRAAEGEKG